MKRFLGFMGLFAGTLIMASSARADIITDSANDIDPGIANAGGTLDILSMEVTSDGTDIQFSLTLNGDVSATDWGKFMIGIATGNSPGAPTGNGWGRPINLNAPSADMNYWIGSWVDGGSGSQLWSYNGSSWDGPTSLGAGFSMVAGASSILTHTVSLASLGVSAGDTIYFDAYSSGGGVTDSAIDALSNPNISVTGWSDTYTSSDISEGGPGLNSFTIVPEPSTIGLLGIGVLAICRGLKRKAS